MKNVLKLSLGVLTSIAGFLEVGSIGTSLQAGAAFRFSLLWPIAVGGICIAFLTEMSGRLAAVGHHTIVDATRERFGIDLHAAIVGGQVVVDVLVLAAEIGGVALALQLATGIALRWWAIPVAFAVWIALWRGTFGAIEHGITFLGLLTLAFVVAAVRLHPDVGALAAGLVPRLPERERASYAFTAVSILGATISPYLISFYSSGAVEERWSERDLGPNRVTAALGMGFGSVLSMAVVVVAAMVLGPRGIVVERYHQAAGVLTPVFPHWGYALFVASLAIGCFGAAVEIALDLSYVLAQAFGWSWGEDQRPAEDARFCLVYSLAVPVACLFTLAGMDPLRLTLVSMAITVLVLPLPIAPLLAIMNDPHYLGNHRNGVIGNVAVVAILVMAVLLALVAIPLEVLGGG